MSPEQKPQPVDPSKLSTINSLILQLSMILSDLLTAARATTDSTKLVQINNEYMGIQSCVNMAAQAQAAENDVLFNQATSALKAQAKVLEDMETQVKKIISDAALAGRIAGYIVQALALIAKL
jgi:hypothetical protein